MVWFLLVCVNSLCIHLKDAKEEEEEKTSLNEIPFSRDYIYKYIQYMAQLKHLHAGIRNTNEGEWIILKMYFIFYIEIGIIIITTCVLSSYSVHCAA